MGRRRAWALRAVACALALLCAGAVLCVQATQARASPPSGPHLRPDGHVALAWLYGGTSAEYRAQVERMTGATVLSPTWWYLDEAAPGALEDSSDRAFVDWAHGRGLAVWPLLGNHINSDLTDQVLRDENLRRQVVARVVELVTTAGVDGVNVDFENLHDATAPLLTTFVAELKAALPAHVISVDVTAMTDTWVLGNWSTAFDRAGLGSVADYVILMAYDQHNALRRGGPVAGLDWVTAATEYLLRTVPAHKVILGVPFYARDWAEDAAAEQGIDLDATLGMAAMGRRLAERSEAVTYDAAAGQDLHTYLDAEGRQHRVWHEDAASLGRKAVLVPAYGLAGIAAWRAGFEDPEAWWAMDAALAAVPAPVPAPPAFQAVPPPPQPTPPPPPAPAVVAAPDPPPPVAAAVAAPPRPAVVAAGAVPVDSAAANPRWVAGALLLCVGAAVLVTGARRGWR